MKKLLILVIVIILASTSVSFGQGRHSIKVGFGTNLMWDYDSRNFDKGGYDKYSLGPTFHIDYGYKMTNYLELGVNLFSLTNHYGNGKDATKMAAFAKITFTPLPQLFRYVRLGVGAGWAHSKYIWTRWDERGSVLEDQFVFDVYIRVYAIDNQRFELYGSYGIYPYFAANKKLYWLHQNISLHFGVKFR